MWYQLNFYYCTKSQKYSTLVCYSPLCEVTWGRKLAEVSQLISHVICLGCKPNSNYFYVLIEEERGRNEDDRYIVYVQTGSIYLAIGAKTSSVRNIVVISPCYPNNSSTADSRSSRDSSHSAIILHTGDFHWLLRSQPRTNRRGRGRVTRALFTAHNWVLHFMSFDT